MEELIPTGFVTGRDAAKIIAAAKYAGIADRPLVTKLRADGSDVADGAAIDDGMLEIWAAVDRGKIDPFGAKGGNAVKLPAAIWNEIPALRSPRCGEFGFLRTRNRHYVRLAQLFGSDPCNITLVFRDDDVAKLSRLVRARRRKELSIGLKKMGRPSIKDEVKRVIREIVSESKWSALQSLKMLTALVNRRSNRQTTISEDTVSRSLAELYAETGDRRFERSHQAPRKSLGDHRIYGSCQ